MRSALDLTASWSIFAVFRTGATVVGHVVSDGYNTTHVSYAVGFEELTGRLRVGTFSGGWNTAIDPAAIPANTVVLASATRVAGGNLTLWKNGAQVAQSASGTTPTFNTGDSLYIGRRWDAVQNVYFNGDIAEIVMFPTALSTAEHQKVEGYMAAKFGLQANLPAGHPYKVTAPQVGSLQVFADQAAATTGGLTVGQIYMTSAGQLMVVY